jgi:peptidoglycan-associated lipoprotein
MIKLFLMTLMIGLLAACASQKTKEEAKQQMPATEVKQEATSDVTKQEPMEAVAPKAQETAIADPLNDLAQRSTYYPFDVSVVQSGDLALVQTYAKYLKAHPDRKVRLEGNCDERGSKKYNRKLGQRRADEVKIILLEGGVMASQIETVSYGEEKTMLACHKEKCWKENRRTDLSYIR